MKNSKVYKLFIQMFKFAIVGLVATIIDFLLLFLFKELFNINTIIANTLSFSISVIFNYLASIKWVFIVNKEKSETANVIVFIVFSVIGLLINDLLMYICIDKLRIYYMISKVIATLIVMIFNFITRKLFLE